MRAFRALPCALLLAVGASGADAQNVAVGTVYELESGAPVAGATIGWRMGEGDPVRLLETDLRGALCARGQSALQGLYNPDRYRSPMIRRNNALVAVSWDEALRTLRERIAALGAGAANAVFINQHETGSFPAFLDQWLAGYGMPAHIAYDGEAPHAVIQANRQTYGVAWPGLDFNAARLIVSVGADFLDNWGASVPQQLAFADARAKLANGPRFVYIGPRRSLTAAPISCAR